MQTVDSLRIGLRLPVNVGTGLRPAHVTEYSHLGQVSDAPLQAKGVLFLAMIVHPGGYCLNIAFRFNKDDAHFILTVPE